MAGIILTAVRAAARIELSVGSSDTTIFTNDEIDRAVDNVVADFSRLIPNEVMYETQIEYDVTAEAFTSAGSHVTASAALDHKPIEPGSDIDVKQGSTTMVRESDYTIDYANGTITTLGRNMATSTSSQITYKKSRIGLDVSSLTSMLTPIRVEWPVGKTPQSMTSWNVFADILWITSRDQESTSKMANKDHVRVYYLGKHTAPTGSAGTAPEFLDDVLIKGTVAYSLFIKAREQMLLSTSLLEQFVTAESISGISTRYDKFDVAIGLLATGTTGVYAKVTAALDATTVPLGDINTALDRIDSLVGDNAGSPAFDALAKMAAEIALANTAIDSIAANDTAVTAELAKLAAFSTANSQLYISAAATANGGNSILLTSSGNHGLTTGDEVELLGMAVSGYNGHYIVRVIDATTFQVDVAYSATSIGYVRVATPTFGINEALLDLSTIDVSAAMTPAAIPADIDSALDKVATHVDAATNSMHEALEAITSTSGHTDANTALDAAAVKNALVSNADASSGALKDAEDTWTADDPGEEDFLVEDVGNSTHIDYGAQEYLQTADGYPNAVNLGKDASSKTVEIAMASIEIAKQYADHRKDLLRRGEIMVGQTQAFINEAESRLTQIDRYLGEASARGDMARLFINEADGRVKLAQSKLSLAQSTLSVAQTQLAVAVQEANARQQVGELELSDHQARQRVILDSADVVLRQWSGHVQEAEARIATARAYAEEADATIRASEVYVSEAQIRVLEVRTHFEEAEAWTRKGELYVADANAQLSVVAHISREADAFANLAIGHRETSDRLLIDAQERHRQYWEMLTSRVHQAKSRSAASSRQWFGTTRVENVSDNLTN